MLIGGLLPSHVTISCSSSCSGVEDFAALWQCLASQTDLYTALKQYKSIRRPRTSPNQSKTGEHQYIRHIDDGSESMRGISRCDKMPVKTLWSGGYEP